jgi:transcriptional regulator with XRE-family HTH domain
MPRLTRHRPDAIDISAGASLYALRSFRGLTQLQLARQLGVSYQQVQKYENGVNRMSASVLYRAARILDISILDFFAGLDGARAAPQPGPSREEVKLLKLFRSIQEDSMRRHVIDLARLAAGYRLDGE